jgi:hypothetical protein
MKNLSQWISFDNAPHPDLLPKGEGKYLLSLWEKIKVRASVGTWTLGFCLIVFLGVNLNLTAATIPEQLPGKRADALVLHTMGSDEMREFILDACEDSLNEYETAWIQETPTTGFWKLPERLYSDYHPRDECSGAMVAYFLCYFERPKSIYAGKYSRELLLKRMQDFRRGNPSVVGYQFVPVIEFMDPMIQSGVWKVPSLGMKVPATAAERDAVYAESLTKRINGPLDIQFMTTMSFGEDFYYYDNASVTNLIDYYRWMYRGLHAYSRQRDRAVNWVEVDRGHSLSEVRANGTEVFFPNCSTTTHDGFEWAYLGSQKYIGYTLLKAAVKGRGVDQVPPPFRETERPELSANFLGFVRGPLRELISPDGSAVWWTGPGDKPPDTCNMSFYFAVDAIVNKNPESAAYLSRSIQLITWILRRPFAPTDPHGGRAILKNNAEDLIPIFYMLKHWGLPSSLPSWEEVQARNGGVAYNRNGDFAIQRNPFKYIEMQAGSFLMSETLIGERNIPICYLGFTPWKQGHSMHFLRTYPFAHTVHFTTKFGLPAESVEFYQTSSWRATIPALIGNYNRGMSSSWNVNLSTRKAVRWDDGFRLAFEHNNTPTTGIKRSVFSLGGRMTAIIEQSNLMGEIAPIRFWVDDLNSTSQRAGYLPKVNWKINLPNNVVIPFSDYQSTTNFVNATLSPLAKWYNVDDLVAVAVPQPAPVVLGCDQFPFVRDTITFGPMKGGSAVVYSGVEAKDMDVLAAEVKDVSGLPTGWKGIQAKAPEGYRVYAIAKFSGGTTNWNYQGKELEGAPVFSGPTTFTANVESKTTFRLPNIIDSCSEEPHFYVTDIQGGGQVTARGDYHRLELNAQGSDAQVTVRFFSGKAIGPITIEGSANWSGTPDSALIRSQGITVNISANKTVFLNIKETGDLYDDRVGPFVDITSPRQQFVAHPSLGYTKGFGGWIPISGLFTIKADAGDRSGIDRVEFYLNKDQLIGTDSQWPYECTYDFKKTHCQYVYAIAYDKVGNSRRSVEVPFGDGSVVKLDTDQDEMIDAWEKSYGLDPFSAADAESDRDGDGFANLQEYFSKTDPILSSSRLKIDAVQLSGSGASFSFPSVNGVKYGIECCDDLKIPIWNVLTNGIVGNGGSFSFTDPNAGSLTKRFYRLKAE